MHVTSGGDFVWTVDAEGLTARRSIELGSISGGDVVITAGLAVGDRVIVAGGRKLEENGREVEISGVGVEDIKSAE